MIIDTHAHLMFDQFKGKVPEILERASAAGVRKIINVGCSTESSEQAVELVEKFDGRNEVELFATLGLHPYDAMELSDDLLAKWEKLIADPGSKVVAIGEIGLDYFKAKVSHEDQKRAFREQLKFAASVGLPVVVHNREADEDSLEILQEFPDLKVVFHCYGSDLEFAWKLWNKGYYTSFTGVITYPNAGVLRDVVQEAPEWTLMVETDCPFLAPQVHRGGTNEPSYVVEVLKEVARLRGKSFGEIEALQERNVNDFYGI
ncbi:TatD family hydrolase [Candidatus Peregrinibacteria bacterium]|mgnify:CR=1 FL=1|jgi:TatD DNase family protein|nr:TatD family hydrolase [Candidatus Peregrinibacteria bacterium]MBT4148152.1 TatD family hydrolase [Candidatus Peregrinibacteria bacterium]MBT4366639.1 TatD family hydrolase [Candidatus Peregrinibacteria bacterium]MBT4455626.1 TatD family hydrolase [Candidatus Peregrinibacteria bacterium]